MSTKPTTGASGATLTTGIVRLAYAHLFEPQPNDAGDMLYSTILLFPVNPASEYRDLGLPANLIDKLAAEHDDRLREIRRECLKVAVEAYGGKDKLPPGIREQDLAKASGWPFRDGKQKEGSKGFEAGRLFVSVSSRFPPAVVDLQNRYILERGDPKRDRFAADMKLSNLSADDVFSGVWAYVSVRPYSFANKGNHGISLGLSNVQFVREDAKLGGGGSRPDEDFAGNALGAASADDLDDLDGATSGGGAAQAGTDELDELLG